MLLIACANVAGLLLAQASPRQKEVAVKAALGAGALDVLKLAARHGLLLIGVGTALGVVASLAVTRLLASFVWGITATDPLTFIAVTLVPVVAGLAACYVPARRAVRIDPMVALRYA